MSRQSSRRFRGQDIAELGHSRYRHAATVFQSLNLLNYMTAVQNITSDLRRLAREDSRGWIER